ncbi:response regulator [Pseudoalteromonas shioyasakiensis]|uniref:response regulator n=1 Tax=Pseudoalteromonas shioyasakiensis TaxID=1190813 RepID=UPI002117F91D|nr:response regulator [Pseudoalteromonas shioyasakiensis]MCQ8878854.1 response regulator [Pseudoalteromonas shioyasakiensis]
MNFLTDKRILVIDDSSLILSAIRLMLINKGAVAKNVILAKDAKTTISACQNRSFDFILFDYNLGQGADGLQLLAHLKMAKLIAKECVIFIVTAEQSRQVVQGFSEWQPDGYLVKPFNINNMLPRMIACYRKKQSLIELEHCYLKRGFERAKNTLSRYATLSYCHELEHALLMWDGQTVQMCQQLKLLVEQGDDNARLSYANCLLNDGKTTDALSAVKPLLAIKRYQLSALDLHVSASLAQGQLQQAYDYLAQMNTVAPDNPQRLLMQFNLAVILNNTDYMQHAVERYQKTTQHLSWLNIDCQFNVLRYLLAQIEGLNESRYGSEFKRLETTYLHKRLKILQNPRALQLHEIKDILDARFALCIGDRQEALQIVSKYSDYATYVTLPFYCQLDIVHLYRRLALPLPDFINNLNKDEHSQHLLLQNTLQYTHSYQQLVDAQIRKIKSTENKGFYMQAVTQCIEAIDNLGINVELAQLLLRGFTKAIPINVTPQQLKQYYLLAKHSLTLNKNQVENSELYFKYCRYVESTVSFLNTQPKVAV